MTKYLIEKGTNYSYLLDNLKKPSFDSIRKLSVNFVNQLPEDVRTELWEALYNGVEVLESEALLSMYMYAYGKMHAAKLQATFEHLPTNKLEDIHLIDWGCGQAMATVVYYEYLKEKAINSTVKTITLIEPSELALKRAALHARKLYPNAEIKTVKKDFDKLTAEDIQIDENQTILHLFSNVLDIEYFKIEHLAELIVQNKAYNLLVCVSPYINEFKNQRLINFISCFQNSNTIADYVNQEWHCGWTIDYKVVEVNLAVKSDNNNSETVTDIDGNVYKTVKIGNQIWMAENLRVSRYRNGDIIPNVIENNEWSKLNTGAWCNYDNNPEYDAKFGKLYNWYTVDDKRGLAPEGWHVPSEQEWYELIEFLGGEDIAGSKMKDDCSGNWKNSFENGTNECGFSALACGALENHQTFRGMGSFAAWWCSTTKDTTHAWNLSIYRAWTKLHYLVFTIGYSIRCIKDVRDDAFEIVWQNGLGGFRNSKGEMITDLKYAKAEKFCNERALVSINEKYGFINKSGVEVVSILYDSADTFQEELSAVSVNGKYGFIDNLGNIIIPLIYDFVDSFNDGLALVCLKGKYGFIDNLGNIVIPILYTDGNSFKDGRAMVHINNKYFFIDKSGSIVIEFDYDFVSSFQQGLAIVSKNKKYGFINYEGELAIPLIYERAYSFIEDLACVKKNNKWGFINFQGKEIISFEYDRVNLFRFKNGLARVKIGNKEGYVDVSGNWIIDSDGSTLPMKTRSTEEFSKEIGVDKLSVYRNKKDILYVAVKDMPSKFVAHVSTSITCKGDLNNHVITTFLNKNGEEYNVLHNLKPTKHK